MKMKLSLGLMCLLLIVGNTFAQKTKVSDVIKINPTNIQPILKGDDVAGYYMFYFADKLKGGDNSYKLRILDENLNEVAEEKIVASKYISLLEAHYNGDVLCFKFYSAKEKEITLRFYDDKAQKIYTKSYEVSKQERRMILANQNQGMEEIPTITPVIGKGFLVATPVKNDKVGYELVFYPNSKTTKGWKYGSKKTSPLLEFITVSDVSEDVIVSIVGLKSTLMSKQVEYQILALDANTGKELFSRKMSANKYEESITNTYYDSKNKEINVFGLYFKRGDNPITDKSIGIVSKTLDLTGKEKSFKYSSWASDISKVAKGSDKAKLKDAGIIYFHKFVRKDDGTFYGVGEAYKKTVSAGGSALKVAALATGGGSGASAFQITVTDFYIFQFDKDKNITGVKVIDKSISRVPLPSGAGIYGAQVLAMLVKAYGGFDFEYAKTINDGKTVAIFYKNYEKRKGEKNKTVAGVISNTNGDYIVDKIDIPTEADFVKVLPAIDGNILFIEYYRKEKNLEFNFKKMNY